jgi:hypothetical protein
MNSQPNDQQFVTDPSLEEMENIMDGVDAEQHDDEHPIFDVEAIEDEDDDDDDILLNEKFNPEKNVTKVGFRKNGLAKGGLVGAAGLVAIVGGLTFFQGQMPKDSKVAEAPQKRDPADEKVESAQSDLTKAQQSESEIKAELALSKQKDSLEQANNPKATDVAAADPNTNSTTAKTATDSNTKVASNSAPNIPIVPPVKPGRAGSSFIASSVVAPTNIPATGATKVANVPIIEGTSKAVAPSVSPANKNISIPPAGIKPLSVVSAPKLATTPTGTLINKNTSSAPAALSLPIAAAPGVPKAPKPAVEAPSFKAPIKEIARVEPTRSSVTKEIARNEPIRSSVTKQQSSENGEEQLPRLRVAPAPGISSETQIASNTLPPPPLYPAPTGINSLGSQPGATPPIAISSAPSLTDFLKTSAAADTPPVAPVQLVALNKEQSKDKQIATVKEINVKEIKDPKQVLREVVVPSKKNSLIASSNKSSSKYNGLISPNSPLTDIADAPPLGITTLLATEPAQLPKPALAQAVPPGTSGTRPAYAHTKMLLAGLPGANTSLGNVESNSPNTQINQVNKTQVVTQNNPVLNQSVPNTPAQNNLGTPVTPVSPIGPIAASILTGTSAKGTTLTPILWGSDSANGAKFVAKLEEPLLANNKREALPAGTQLIVVAKPSNNNSNNNSNSLVEVEVVGVIVQGKEYATPPGAIVIHDENNGLLVGEDYFKREDQIASRDYMTVLGGALNTLGQVLNRPSGSFSSNFSGLGSSSTNIINNRDPNIFGALLEGGFKDIPGIWNQRNQQALAQLANQPKVYQIPKGRTIRVFVNQSISF